MRTPVFRFLEERLTDAPMDGFRTRLAAPDGLASLRTCRGLRPLEVEGEELVLRWHYRPWPGAVMDGTLRVRPQAPGAHLRLDGRLRGWSGFLVLGWMRWRTEHVLDRLVGEL